jgi:hypothetical protein
MTTVTSYTQAGVDAAIAAAVADVASEAADLATAVAVENVDIAVGSSKGKNFRMEGPVTTDLTSVVQNSVGDGTLTKQYLLPNSGAVPAAYPLVPVMHTPKALTNSFGYIESLYPVFGGVVRSVMTDAPKFVIKFGYATSGYAWQAWVDGAPVSLDPVVGNSGLYLNFNFPSGGKARRIDLATRSGVGSLYMAPPYRAWKPIDLPSPRILVMGDSYVQTTSYDAAGAALPGEFGIYHRMRPDLGVLNMAVDGVGGSGYIQRNASGIDAPNNNYADRLARAVALDPDVLIVHGGGANDLAVGGYSVAAIAAAVEAFFESARASLPNAKLVFVEGFSPPGGFSTLNDEYTAIRVAAQAALAATGVYYIDVATTAPWLDGTGYFGATNGTGNSDIYVGPDAVHLMAAGSSYIRSRMADRLRVILADNGSLVNQLI